MANPTTSTALTEDNTTIIVRARQGGVSSMDDALAAVQEEQERLALWRDLEDANRHLVLALVRSSLRRLLDSPHWVPASTRLGDRRLDISIVVELDATQVAAEAAAAELDVEVAEAYEQVRSLIAQLEGLVREDGDGAAS